MSSYEESTIRAYQKILPTFDFDPAKSFSERFAQDRYKSKMEVPDPSRTSELSSLCWNNWLRNDLDLPVIRNPPREWYLARDFLFKKLKGYYDTNLDFPKGSEFHPTRGMNSVEARLSQSRWTVTRANFDEFARAVYKHKALKRAFRIRYRKWFLSKKFDITMKQSDKYLFKRFSGMVHKNHVPYSVFRWKLSMIVTFVEGSRFSTVPKNNEKRRPINIEPFGNVITQRMIGNWLRSEILRIFDVDLDSLADTHRVRIRKVEEIATIDLKDASDSISLDLCRFLLPRRILSLLESTRSEMVYGPDGSYHITKKISSMGNGFTFELMTLILLTLCRMIDPQATVFGDDIIIRKDVTDLLITCLTSVGLKVNTEKSFTSGPFRESCGANYHQDEGYVESYDFRYPSNIGDCVMIWNKCVRLSRIYPSFMKLRNVLFRALPHALHGGPDIRFLESDSLDIRTNGHLSTDVAVDFPPFFVTDKVPKDREGVVACEIRESLLNLQYNPNDFKIVHGYEFKSSLRSPTLRHLPSSRWAKYEMYLSSGRKSKDVLSGKGEWKKVWFVNSGTEVFRIRPLMA